MTVKGTNLGFQVNCVDDILVVAYYYSYNSKRGEGRGGDALFKALPYSNALAGTHRHCLQLYKGKIKYPLLILSLSAEQCT